MSSKDSVSPLKSTHELLVKGVGLGIDKVAFELLEALKQILRVGQASPNKSFKLL